VDPTKTETFKQPLLWDRLLPNPTFLPGVLLGLLWAVLPVFVVLFWLRKQGAWRMNAMQLSAAGVILLAFLGVGLTASVKIGGGGDLHNMDIFLVTILMLVASAWPEIIEKIRHGKQSINSKLLVYFMLVMPLFYTVYWSGSVLVLATPAETAAAIRVIQKHASAAQSYGQVLFLDQRQLLTFGYVQDIIMVSDYEKKKLIDKAMSANAEYFSPFYSALANHRFSLIVSERIFLSPGDPNGPFAEENDAWMQWVAIPLLEYYQPLVTLKAVGIQLLVPRDNPSP
ncbi:MAG: hypothetical protein OEZ02_04180, partial [Anaerolineae bacterium]|nr:hypothetical protein [Anaerolineae bacterium]